MSKATTRVSSQQDINERLEQLHMSTKELVRGIAILCETQPPLSPEELSVNLAELQATLRSAVEHVSVTLAILTKQEKEAGRA